MAVAVTEIVEVDADWVVVVSDKERLVDTVVKDAVVVESEVAVTVAVAVVVSLSVEVAVVVVVLESVEVAVARRKV